LIDPQDERLSLVRQCALVGIARSSFYYRPVGESRANLRLMRLMDELHMNCPWYGSLQMVRTLRRMGHRVTRKWVRQRMLSGGLQFHRERRQLQARQTSKGVSEARSVSRQRDRRQH